MQYVYKYVLIVTWLAGLVLAKGFWSSFFAFILPPWAWYTLVEQVLVKLNFI
jgi:hypothetical protein